MAGGRLAATLRFDAELLARAGGWHGRVAAVFSHAALVESADGELVTLLHPQRDLGPLGVSVPWALVPAGGQAVTLEGRRLDLGGGVVALEGPGRSLRLPTTLPPPDPEALREQLGRLVFPTRARELLGGGPDPEMEPLHAGLTRLAYALRESRGIEGAARALLGLGPGATPSGDDLLVGAAAAATRLQGWLAEDATFALLAVLRFVPPTATTPVSRALLGHAARGAFPEPLLLLVRAFGDRAVDPLPAARRLVALGAQSGCDLLAGAVAVAQLALERA